MRKLAALTGAVALAAGLGACSSSGSSSTSSPSAKATTMSGTETITATVAGTAAAKQLNSTASNAPLTFIKIVFTGPVATSVSPFTLGGGNKTTGTFKTPAGNLVVTHSSGNKGGQANPTVTGKTGDVCYFKQTFAAGTYTVDGAKSTGKFAGATGSGTFAINMTAAAKLSSGKTTCTTNNTGSILATGASVTFKGTGPLTVK